MELSVVFSLKPVSLIDDWESFLHKIQTHWKYLYSYMNNWSKQRKHIYIICVFISLGLNYIYRTIDCIVANPLLRALLNQNGALHFHWPDYPYMALLQRTNQKWAELLMVQNKTTWYMQTQIIIKQ